MNSDFRELLQCFAAAEVRYLVVGRFPKVRFLNPLR